MALFGWIVLAIFSLLITVGVGVMALMSSAWSGKMDRGVGFVLSVWFVVLLALWYCVFHFAPFTYTG